MSRPAWDVVGVGANSVDEMLVLPLDPPPSLTVSAKATLRDRRVRCGGQTATTLVTCASLGLRASYVGPIGEDADGGRVRRALRGRGVDVSHLATMAGATQTATILVHPETGSRVALSTRAGRVELTPAHVPDELVARAQVVHVDEVHFDAALHAARVARRAGVPVTSDIDRVSERTGELLAEVTYPILAEDTPRRLTGRSDLEAALREIRRTHPGVLCVTLGEKGALALDGDRILRQEAFPVEVRDPTGAGDVFRGAFIVGLRAGWAVPRILRFAAAVAALSCTRVGAMAGVPSAVEVERLSGERLEVPVGAP